MVYHFVVTTECQVQSSEFKPCSASTEFSNTGWNYFVALMPESPGSFLESQLGGIAKGFVKGHINGRGTESLRTGQGFYSIFIVTDMTETYMGIPLLNVFPTKEIKSYKMCLGLPCFPARCVMEQALVFMPVEKWGLAGKCSMPQDQDPSAHKCLAHAPVCTHIPSKEGRATRLLLLQGRGHLPTTQPPDGKLLRLGRTSVPIYWVFTVPTYRISRVLP